MKTAPGRVSSATVIDIERDGVAELASQLVRFDTQNPPGDEAHLASFLAARLQGVGCVTELQVVEPGRANVIGTLAGSSGPHLLLVGHLDTVPVGTKEEWSVPPLQGLRRNGRLYGRGSSDMKGALASMLSAVESLAASGEPQTGSVSFVGLCDEEISHAGARHFVSQGARADWAVIGEPTRLRRVLASKGNALIRIRLRGRSAHSSTPEQGRNAIVAAGSVIEALTEHARELARQHHPLCGSPTLNVGEISGGESPWSVPERCELQIDRRLLPGEDPHGATADLAEALSTRAGDCELEVNLEHSVPAVEIRAGSEVVHALRQVATQLFERDRGEGGWAATSDAAVLSARGGIPSVVCGPGDLARDAHQADESVELDELVAAARLYAGTARALLAVPQDPA